MPRILILGGTTEARELAARLAALSGYDVTLSLAGRTANPARQPVPVRIGGFGGAAGLADYLLHERFNVLVDATHPYAATIAANAVEAARRAGIRLLALRRPAWTRCAGDRWIETATAGDAVQALGDTPRRVFVALGRKELAPLAGAPQHFYLIRSVDPVEPPLPLPHARYITARGPFSEAAELALMQAHAIDAVIAKNSGGRATYGKIAAARTLGIAVLMLQRPAKPDAPTVAGVEEAVARLHHAHTCADARGL